MPTTLNVEVTFELLTDGFPEEISWSLVDNSKDGAIVHSGPSVGEIYNAKLLYSFTWVLNRCTSYTLKIYDTNGDGLLSLVDGIEVFGRVEVKTERRQVKETLRRIDGNYGSKSSISFNICNDNSDN
jgi:hypothetical protein